jgi:hypothetical protein
MLKNGKPRNFYQLSCSLTTAAAIAKNEKYSLKNGMKCIATLFKIQYASAT